MQTGLLWCDLEQARVQCFKRALPLLKPEGGVLMLGALRSRAYICRVEDADSMCARARFRVFTSTTNGIMQWCWCRQSYESVISNIANASSISADLGQQSVQMFVLGAEGPNMAVAPSNRFDTKGLVCADNSEREWYADAFAAVPKHWCGSTSRHLSDVMPRQPLQCTDSFHRKLYALGTLLQAVAVAVHRSAHHHQTCSLLFCCI